MQQDQADTENRDSLVDVITLLRYEERQDLSGLLADAYVVFDYLDTAFPLTGGEATFELVEANIHAPVSACKKLRDLSGEDHAVILNALQEAWPTSKAGGMYIQSVSFTITRESLSDGLTHLFTSPLGWQSVDRRMDRIRELLTTASTEEHFQEIGLQCRQCLISVAQTVFDSAQHPPLPNDAVEVSKNDSKRMINRYVASECPGSSRREVRKCAYSAVDLANKLTHSDTATHSDALLCAQATFNMVGLLAIVSGKRDRDELRSNGVCVD